MKHVLSIAGTDPSGGAGAAADCKTFCAHGCFALNVITAVVSQNTQGVRGYMDVTPDLIADQIDAVFEDIDVDAVKIGMVSVPETIRVIADKLRQYQPRFVVIDPVMVATSGHRLLEEDAVETLRKRIVPLADLLTPNRPEAELLAGMSIAGEEDMAEAGKRHPLRPARYTAAFPRPASRSPSRVRSSSDRHFRRFPRRCGRGWRCSHSLRDQASSRHRRPSSRRG